MPHLSPDTKHAILQEYTPRSATHSFAALARRHSVKGGADVVRHWHDRWDGTLQSLKEKQRSGRPPALTPAEVSRHVRAPILAANRAHRAVSYTQLLPEVRRKTGKSIALRTLQQIGKQQLQVKSKSTRKRTRAELAAPECDQIAEMRRKLQRNNTTHVLFLDETALRLSEAPTHTLVLPGEQSYVVATETSSYARRYDMIACCASDRVLLPKIYSPQERSEAGVKGINGAMLHQFIDDTLAQAVEGLDRYPLTLVLDRAPIQTNIDAIRQAFSDRGSQSIKDILLMPPNAAKRLSPLDNSIFHDWKEEVRKHCPVTANTIEQVMNDAWEKVQPASHYKHCGLKRNTDPYFDCPAPDIHRHNS